MTELPLVSVIMPVYNAENTVEASIQSVLQQTYSSIELILINDGSTDDSETLCKKFAQKDNRVHYLKQNNAGPSSARNNALNLAKGEYITFIDSDDVFIETAIERMVSHKADLVIANYNNVTQSTSEINQGDKLPSLAGTYSRDEFLAQYGVFFQANLVHYLWHKLYKAELLKNIRFDETLKIGEDLLFNIAYLSKITNVKVIDEVVVNHTKDKETSLTKSFQPHLFDYRKAIYTETRSFLMQQNQWNEKNRNSLTQYFSRKFYTALYNYFQGSSPLSWKEKRSLSKQLINDSLVQELIKDIKSYSMASKVYGVLIQKEKPLLFQLFASSYFYYVSFKDKKRESK